MKQIKRKIIFSCILPCLSFANCLKEIFSHGLVSSWRKLRAEVNSICSKKEQKAIDDFVFEVEILNPISAEHTREHLDQRVLSAFNSEYGNCEDKPLVDLGQCLTDFMLKKVGREIPEGLDPIHPSKATKVHHSIGKLKNSQGQCSFTAVSNNIGMTALHCFYNRIIPSEHFGKSLNDLLQTRKMINVSFINGDKLDLEIKDFLVFNSLSNLNFVEDDMVLFKVKKKSAFKEFLPLKSVNSLMLKQKFFMAGMPGVYNFDSFSMYQRETDSISKESNRVYTNIITYKGDSGSGLRVQEEGQDYVIGTLFGSEKERTVFAAITDKRKQLIDKFLQGTLSDQERSFQFEELEQ